MSNIGPTTAREMNKDFQRRIGRLERALGGLVAPRSGPTENRPDPATLRIGTSYFDTDLSPQRPVYATPNGWSDPYVQS